MEGQGRTCLSKEKILRRFSKKILGVFGLAVEWGHNSM